MGSHMTGSGKVAQVEYIRDMYDHNTRTIYIPAPPKKRSFIRKLLRLFKGNNGTSN